MFLELYKRNTPKKYKDNVQKCRIGYQISGSISLTLILTVAIGNQIPNTLLTRGTLGLKTAYREAFQKDSGNKIIEFNPLRMA